MELHLLTGEDVASDFREAVRAFIFERESRGLSRKSIRWYTERLDKFCRWDG